MNSCPVCSNENWNISRYKNCGMDSDAICKYCGAYFISGKGWDLTTLQNNKRFDENKFDSNKYKRINKFQSVA